MALSFTMTNDSIVVIYQGKSHTVARNQPQFTGLRKAIIEENWDDVPNHLTIAKSLNTWAKGKFTFNDVLDLFSYEGLELPPSINKRIVTMATRGEDPTPMFNFFERLNRNPSMRSVEQLYPFLEHQGIAITPDGYFLAYKGVKDNYRDCHSGKIDNRPGEVVKVPRNRVSDDPQKTCHFGLHAGSKSYATSYGSRLVTVKIDPEHVVCVPYDSSEKLRCCEYTVIGNTGDDLPGTVHEEQDLPSDEPEQSDPADENDDAFNNDITDVDDVEEGDDEDDEDQGKLFDLNKGEFKKEEAPKPGKTAGGMGIPSKYAEKAKLELDELMRMSLGDLRELATHGLKIIGASKIPGGKSALVQRIIAVRDSSVK